MAKIKIAILDDGTLGVDQGICDCFSNIKAEINAYSGPSRLQDAAESNIIVASVADIEALLQQGEAWGKRKKLIACGDPGEMDRALHLGVADFLPQPLDITGFTFAIRKAAMLVKSSAQEEAEADPLAEQACKGKIITIYSPTGGIGKTMLAVNLAAAIAKHFKRKTVLVDLNLQFPGADLMLNLTSMRTIIDLLPRLGCVDSDFLESFLTKHASGLNILPASLKPEDSERVVDTDIRNILASLREKEYVVVVDTSSNLTDITLAALDVADKVILLTSLELLALRNTRICLETMASLEYDREKIDLVLNRASSKDLGVKVEDAENLLGEKFISRLPSSGECVVKAANYGHPFVISQPDCEISRSIRAIAQEILYGEAAPAREADDVSPDRGGLVIRKARRLLGL